jgi:hypothetical protein
MHFPSEIASHFTGQAFHPGRIGCTFHRAPIAGFTLRFKRRGLEGRDPPKADKSPLRSGPEGRDLRFAPTGSVKIERIKILIVNDNTSSKKKPEAKIC